MGDIGIGPVGPYPVGHIYPLVELSGYMDKQVRLGRVDAVSLRTGGDYLPDPVLIDRLDLILDSSEVENIPVLWQVCHIVIYDLIEVWPEDGIVFTYQYSFIWLDSPKDFYVA